MIDRTRDTERTEDTDTETARNNEATRASARDEIRRPDNQEEVRVPVVEERLDVEKRASQVGEVQLHKTVTEEQRSVPVELMREEVHVEKRDVADRPAAETDKSNAFQETTIRVPVRGEEAVVSKEAVVTGEVVISKERTTETEQVSDTVRREHVEVQNDFDRVRDDFQRHFNDRNTRRDRTFDHAEPNYRQGFYAGRDERYAGREFEHAEPHLRREYESRARDGDGWEQLREEIREGWDRARSR